MDPIDRLYEDAMDGEHEAYYELDALYASREEELFGDDTDQEES